ncbi:MAG: hypothetical protein WCG85_13250 [Polyangia bacterium]
MPIKITIGGREFDLSQAEDAIAVEANLVPANWPTSPAECVRLFTATTEMLTYQLKRHLGANWQKICKQTQEELADGNPGRIQIGFAFELDQSAPTVAAIAEHSLGFSVAHKTKGKPQSYDINQGTFDETMAKDPEIGAEEPTEATAGETQAELAPGDTSTPPEPENPATATESGQATPPDNVVDIGTAAEQPEKVDKPRRGRPKGSRNKQKQPVAE